MQIGRSHRKRIIRKLKTLLHQITLITFKFNAFEIENNNDDILNEQKVPIIYIY